MKNLLTNKPSEKLDKIQTYTLYFFIFAILGWIMETIFSFIVLGHFTKRGFLYGPLCPIYGFGSLILIIFLSKYKNNKIKLFVIASVIFSIFEYLTSYALEVLFHSFWWDYTYDFLNLNGRISIFYTFAWGIIAIVFVCYLYPIFKKIIDKIFSKISYTIKNCIVYITFLVFIIDIILSCIKYLNI